MAETEGIWPIVPSPCAHTLTLGLSFEILWSTYKSVVRHMTVSKLGLVKPHPPRCPSQYLQAARSLIAVQGHGFEAGV
jgi:hypothetical protein